MIIIGLDNGIIIKSTEKIKAPFWVKLEFYNEADYILTEVCYWRKCWGLRNKILDTIFRKRQNVLLDEEKDILTSKDIKTVMKIIQHFIKPKIWEEEGDSISEWNDIKWRLLQQWINLHWLARYMKKNNVEVYFYDSY